MKTTDSRRYSCSSPERLPLSNLTRVPAIMSLNAWAEEPATRSMQQLVTCLIQYHEPKSIGLYSSEGLALQQTFGVYWLWVLLNDIQRLQCGPCKGLCVCLLAYCSPRRLRFSVASNTFKCYEAAQSVCIEPLYTPGSNLQSAISCCFVKEQLCLNPLHKGQMLNMVVLCLYSPGGVQANAIQ